MNVHGTVRARDFSEIIKMADPQHATPLGQIADDFDQMVEEDREWLVGNLTAWAHGDPNDPGWLQTIRHGIAGYVYVDFHVVTGVASGYADVLRFGNGFASGYQNGDYWGYLEDSLRGLVLLGPVARGLKHAKVGIGRAIGPRMAKFIKQLPTRTDCSWLTSVKALRMTGVRPLARVSELVRKAAIPGVQSAEQASWSFLEPLMGAMRKLGAKPKQLSFHSIEDLLKYSSSNPKGVVAFSVEYGAANLAQKPSHSMLMSAGEIHDTMGKVYKSVAELKKTYENASLIVNHWAPGMGSQYLIPNAAVLISPGAKQLGDLGTLAAMLHSLALEMNEFELGVRFSLGPARPVQRPDRRRPSDAVPERRRLTEELKADEETVYYAIPEFNTLIGELELMRRTGLPGYKLRQAIVGLTKKNLIMHKRGTNNDVPYGWVRVR